MCGRYSFAPSLKQKTKQLDDLNHPAEWKIRYNVAPTQSAYVIANDNPRLVQEMNWGLVPFWSKDGKNSGKMINARSETIFEKPAFRKSILTRRCLVPADSFYEWRKEPDGRKLPYRIFQENGDLLFMAGIWDHWGSGSSALHTFSIITTDANDDLADLHDRMPLILPTKEARHQWLSDLPTESLEEMLQPPREGLLTMYRVSELVNNTRNEGPALQEKVEESPRLF